MDWEMLWETICKYWVQQLCVLAFAGISQWYNKRFKKYAEDQKAVRKAMMALLRDRFYQGYKIYIKQGYYPIRDREVMQDIYNQYHAQGGNGVISHQKADLDELPTYSGQTE